MRFARSDLRVSDTDRDAAAEFLKRHYEAGRLSHHELSERVDAAYGALYESELAALARDLPALRPDAPAPRPRTGRALVLALAALALVVALALAPGWAWFVLGLVLLVVFATAVAVSPVALPVLLVLWLVRTIRGSSRPLPHGHGGFLSR